MFIVDTFELITGKFESIFKIPAKLHKYFYEHGRMAKLFINVYAN